MTVQELIDLLQVEEYKDRVVYVEAWSEEVNRPCISELDRLVTNGKSLIFLVGKEDELWI